MRRAILVAAISLILGTSGCVSNQKIGGDRDASDLDRTLSTFVWVETGDIATFIVNTQIARYRDDANYVPFQIAVANHGLHLMDLSREAFVLVDEEGVRYPAAGPRELVAEYPYLDLDRSPGLADLEGIVADRFAANTRYVSTFFPTIASRQAVVRDRMTLPRHGYLIDFVYFPTPPTGVKGHRFVLEMQAT